LLLGDRKMQVVYKVRERLFESEKEAREFENLERIHLISQINQMKDCILPKAYKRTVQAKEDFSAFFKMSKKNIFKNGYEVSLAIQEVVRSEIALEEKIRAYKKLREQLEGM
jgi:hypothetical protein